MGCPVIPGLYPDENCVFALWATGHGPNSSETRMVFCDTESAYQIRRGFRFHGCWKTSQTALPAATFAGIIEWLEMIAIPLVVEPQGSMSDGATRGFAYNKWEQIVIHLVLSTRGMEATRPMVW
jgi:hypothetical protein